MDETTCYTIYQIRNFLVWTDVAEFLLRMLPLVIFGWFVYFAFWKTRRAAIGRIYWRELRVPILLSIPWAIAQTASNVFFAFCYAS